MDMKDAKIITLVLLLLLFCKRDQILLGERPIAIGSMALLMSVAANDVKEMNVHHTNLLHGRNIEHFVLSRCTSDVSSLLYPGIASSFKSSENFQYDNSMPDDWFDCNSSVASELHSYEGLEVLEVEHKLVGNGAHRELSTFLTIKLRKNSVCQVVVAEKLSSGVFADVFELEGLVARHVYMDARVYGDHNLELPALHSSQSIVVLHTFINNSNADPEQLQPILRAKVSLPLHARYPPLSLAGHVPVNFSLPYVLFHCSDSNNLASPANVTFRDMDGNSISWSLLSWRDKTALESAALLQWSVPAGNPLHTQFVAVTTACTAIIGVVILLVVSSYSFGYSEYKSV